MRTIKPPSLIRSWLPEDLRYDSSTGLPTLDSRHPDKCRILWRHHLLNGVPNTSPALFIQMPEPALEWTAGTPASLFLMNLRLFLRFRPPFDRTEDISRPSMNGTIVETDVPILTRRYHQPRDSRKTGTGRPR